MTTISQKTYALKSKGNIHWELAHCRYRIIPELQDAIAQMFYRTTPEYQTELLKRHNKENLSILIHFLSISTLVEIESELFNLLN